MRKTPLPPQAYLSRAEQLGLLPNFFMSSEYIGAANWRVFEQKGVIRVESRGEAMLPPLSLEKTVPDSVWCDVESYHGLGKPEVLDFEFLYMGPTYDRTMHKHHRRFEKECPDYQYHQATVEDVLRVFSAWALNHLDMVFEGLDAFERGLPNYGLAGLYWQGTPLAVNVWDTNYAYTNYRYTFDSGVEPYAGEYARMLFHRNTPGIINDGGSLGNKNLESYKRRMGPVEVRERHSWVS